MSCFFPTIFKKNTYKKVRFLFVSAFILLMLLLSGCNAIKSAVSFPLRVIGDVGEKIAGSEHTKSPESPLEGGSGGNIDDSGRVLGGDVDVICFEALALWAIMLIAIASGVRYLVNRYVHKNTKK